MNRNARILYFRESKSKDHRTGGIFLRDEYPIRCIGARFVTAVTISKDLDNCDRVKMGNLLFIERE